MFLAGAGLLLLLSTCLYTGWGAWALLGGGIGLATGGFGLLSRHDEENESSSDRTEQRLRHLEAIAAQGKATDPGHSPSVSAH